MYNITKTKEQISSFIKKSVKGNNFSKTVQSLGLIVHNGSEEILHFGLHSNQK